MRFMRVFLVAAMLAGAVLAGPAAVGNAAAPKSTRLTLTIANGEAASPVVKRALLRCEPAGGSHRRATAACAALRKVNGNFAALDVVRGVCTMEYAPKTVTATGTYRGREVRFQRTFSNECGMRNQGGPVYRL
jgi:hypothetical protein